jgi:hypothetical protein
MTGAYHDWEFSGPIRCPACSGKGEWGMTPALSASSGLSSVPQESSTSSRWTTGRCARRCWDGSSRSYWRWLRKHRAPGSAQPRQHRSRETAWDVSAWTASPFAPEDPARSHEATPSSEAPWKLLSNVLAEDDVRSDEERVQRGLINSHGPCLCQLSTCDVPDVHLTSVE